jgi:hypothetical protein
VTLTSPACVSAGQFATGSMGEEDPRRQVATFRGGCSMEDDTRWV